MKTLQQRDLDHVWHPCSQMKDYENFAPYVVKRASGSYIEFSDGHKVIDAVSSWWCKSLGHGHPHIRNALMAQAERFEHVIMANTCQETLVELSEKLTAQLPGLNRVFYAGDGSCAVEIALKMAMHAQQLLGHTQRTQFMALENGYHGETALALGASDVGVYRQAYESILPKIAFLQGIPYVSGKHDPLWHDCSEHWPAIEAQLNRRANSLAAFILEPVLQGAGGMKIYSQDFLRRLHTWCKQHDVYLIADEIMTGFGRSGLPFAVNHANIMPDIICLSKGLTSGWLPLSAVVCHDNLYQLFYDDYETGKAFLHSHTYSGNALAAACALATLEVFEQENIYQRVADNSDYLFAKMQQCAEATGKLHNLRHLGFVCAADLDTRQARAGYQVFQQAIKHGAWLRPLGNTVYWLPPLNIERETIDALCEITQSAILDSGV